MAEQWIPAAKALEIGGDRYALCSRLHAGLLTAKARLLKFNQEEHHWAKVPDFFWWAEGHEALDQNWAMGDFSTWIEGKHQMQAFDVHIDLFGLLKMLNFEQRAATARGLSVTGDPRWLTAHQARALVYTVTDSSTAVSDVIIEQARLGFVTARAVLAQAAMAGARDQEDCSWEEREWDIPIWFWNDFTVKGRSTQDWSLGKFSGHGPGPKDIRWMTLSGVHFLRASLEAMAPPPPTPEPNKPPRAGAPQKYDWAAATNAVWGQLYDQAAGCL